MTADTLGDSDSHAQTTLTCARTRLIILGGDDELTRLFKFGIMSTWADYTGVIRSGMAPVQPDDWVDLQPGFVPLSPLGLSVWAGLCRVAWGLCKYTLTLGGMEAQRDFPWLAPVNGACLAKQMHHPPPSRSRLGTASLGSWEFSLRFIFAVAATPQFLSRHRRHWVSIWCGCLLWWWFFPTDVIRSRTTGSAAVSLF